MKTEPQKQKLRAKQPAKDSANSQAAKKKSPLINKSFACYNISSKTFKYNESFSKDRNRTLSIGNSTPISRRVGSMRISVLNSSGKLSNGHPGPKELEESKRFKQKKELVGDWLEKAKNEIDSGSYSSAFTFLKKVVKEEPNNLKALYLRAQCYIGQKEFKLAIPDLLSIIQDHPMYNKNVYIDLASCFIDSKDYSTAIRQITRGLLKFPKFLEGYVSRGTLFNSLKKWDKAIKDFYEAIAIGPTDGSVYIGLADSLIGMGELESALKMIEQALKFPSSVSSALLKRGKILFESQDFDKALEDFNTIITTDPSNVEAHYFKAFSLLGKDNLIDAAVALEQVIKYDVSKKFTGHAIYNLGAIKIKQRDFYGAHFTFQRAVELGIEIEEQKVLKGYVEAILSLMKRKFKEGASFLSKIIKKKHVLIKEYLGNCYAYRGYAYASLENHEKAVKDLSLSKKMQDLDHSSEYNLLVSQAILFGNTDDALDLLEKASELFPKNIEPFIYKSAIYFYMSRSTANKALEQKSRDLLDFAIKIRNTESDSFFFRGILLYYLNKPIEAVYDFEQAIEKAEDNVANHFLARGLCSSKLNMFKEAIQDFSIAIQLDETLADAYFFRGWCAFLSEDAEQASKDFSQALAMKPDEVSFHYNFGNFLMLSGEIDEAINAFNQAFKLKNSADVLTQKIKCFLIQENLSAAVFETNKLNQLKGQKNSFDLEVFMVLQNALNESMEDYNKLILQLNSILQNRTEGEICKAYHVHLYKGVFFLYLGEFAKAQNEFSSVIVKSRKKDQSMERNNIELIYNLALTYILDQKYEEALKELNEIVFFLEDTDRGKALLIMGILQYALDQTKPAKTLLTEAFKYDEKTVGGFLEEKPDLKISLLSVDSKLAGNHSFFRVSIGESHPVLLKPSFSLPRPSLENFSFDAEEGILKCFSLKTIKCKPETPWLNRVKGSIQFTDQIQHIETESVSEEPDFKLDFSDIFSEKSLRVCKSQEFSISTPPAIRKIEESSSSLS